jgi:hypothetical protein
MKKLMSVMAIAAMGVGTGCAATAEPEKETELTQGPVARVDVDGHSFEFFEIEPGVVVTREMGPVTAVFKLADPSLQKLAPLDLFHVLAPNAEPPPALLEAAGRWAAAHPNGSAPSELGSVKQPISIDNSHGYGCQIDLSIPQYKTTTTSWLWSKTWDDVHSIDTDVCNTGDKRAPITVSFKHRRWYDWTSIKTDVAPGYYVYWSASDGTFDFDVQLSVLNTAYNTVRIAKTEHFYGY